MTGVPFSDARGVLAVDGDPLADVRAVETPVVALEGGRVAFDRRRVAS